MKNEKRTLKTWISRIVVAVALSSLLYGCGGTKIYQDIDTNHDYDNCLKYYDIRTTVHTHNWEGRSTQCIYLEDVDRVPESKRDSVANAEYKKAELFEKKVNECFDDL